MGEGVIIALISASAVIIAAIIGLFKKESGDKTVVRQRARGNGITQVGVQIDKREARDKHE